MIFGRPLENVHSHLTRKGDGMYLPVSCNQINMTVSKSIKMDQKTLNGVAVLYNVNCTALGMIERVPMSFGRDSFHFTFFSTYQVHFQKIISQRQVTIERRSLRHFSRQFKGFPHAPTYNPSCAEVS